MTRTQKNYDCGEISFCVVKISILLSLNIMTRFLEIKFLNLTKVYKKGPTTKQNPHKKKQKRKT
jgi:hypothetical protein